MAVRPSDQRLRRAGDRRKLLLMTETPAVIPYLGEHSEDDLDLFGDYRYLYPIVIEGRAFEVPEDNCVLRICQYIELRERTLALPWKDYCWNNTDGCCEMTYRESMDAPVRKGRACRVQVKPGMEILSLPKGGRWCVPEK